MKEPQQRYWVRFEKILGWDGQPLALDDESAEGAPAAAPSHPREAVLALLIGFKDRAKDPGQVADILSNQEIVLHEALDAPGACAIGVPHSTRDFGLHIEGQPFLGASG